MARYTWLLFDADGTLFDFQRAEAIALENTPHKMGLVVPSNYAATYHQINNALWTRFEAGELRANDIRRERFRLLFKELDLVGDALAFGEAFLDNLIQESTFLEGAQSLIAQLKNHYHLALLTNGFASVQHARIARLGLGDLFNPVIISEEVGVAKPNPAIFDIALKEMGLPDRTEVLMIGDSLSSDIRGGSNAGIDTCWFNPLSSANETDVTLTYEISLLGDLPALLVMDE
jgi:2-haloacid dehalogenase